MVFTKGKKHLPKTICVQIIKPYTYHSVSSPFWGTMTNVRVESCRFYTFWLALSTYYSSAYFVDMAVSKPGGPSEIQSWPSPHSRLKTLDLNQAISLYWSRLVPRSLSNSDNKVNLFIMLSILLTYCCEFIKKITGWWK